MTQEDRKLMLEAFNNIGDFMIPHDISPASIPLDGMGETKLFKDPMAKQVERALRSYEQTHPGLIPFKSLSSELWLINIDKKGGIKLVKRLNGMIAQSMHMYDDTAILYYYKNITIGIAVHDHTESKSLGSYYWYFIPGSDLAETHVVYYLCSAYYSEYGVTEYLLKCISQLNKS